MSISQHKRKDPEEDEDGESGIEAEDGDSDDSWEDLVQEKRAQIDSDSSEET